MAEYEHLSNAPILESVLEIKVQPAAGFASSGLVPFVKSVEPTYPNQKETRRIHSRVRFDSGNLVSAESGPRKQLGFRLESSDRASVVHVETDRFAFSRLKPYTRWEEVALEAMGLWRSYRLVAKPLAIVRVGLRYVNSFHLPPDTIDASRYLRAPIPLPSGLEVSLDQVFSRVVINDDKTPAQAGVVQVIDRDVESKAVRVILDIDAFQAFDGGDAQMPDRQLQEIIDQLRNFKNQIFFSSITNDAAAMWR